VLFVILESSNLKRCGAGGSQIRRKRLCHQVKYSEGTFSCCGRGAAWGAVSQ